MHWPAPFHERSPALRERRRRLVCAGALVVLALARPTSEATDEKVASPPTAAPAAPPSAQAAELRGKVVCLPEEMHAQHQTDLPTNHEHLFGFKTAEGSYYTLLRTKFSEAVFLDPKLREK